MLNISWRYIGQFPQNNGVVFTNLGFSYKSMGVGYVLASQVTKLIGKHLISASEKALPCLTISARLICFQQLLASSKLQ